MTIIFPQPADGFLPAGQGTPANPGFRPRLRRAATGFSWPRAGGERRLGLHPHRPLSAATFAQGETCQRPAVFPRQTETARAPKRGRVVDPKAPSGPRPAEEWRGANSSPATTYRRPRPPVRHRCGEGCRPATRRSSFHEPPSDYAFLSRKVCRNSRRRIAPFRHSQTSQKSAAFAQNQPPLRRRSAPVTQLRQHPAAAKTGANSRTTPDAPPVQTKRGPSGSDSLQISDLRC